MAIPGNEIIWDYQSHLLKNGNTIPDSLITMEPYLIISNLNDFIFCPRSIYFHNLYGQYSVKTYHRKPQTAGLIAHRTIDESTYSTKSHHITSLRVYSEEYRLCGAIDLYDSEKKALIERKRQIKVIYPGYRYQLWAQYLCMVEMGYEVEQIFFHSLIDNKRYPEPLPDEKALREFQKVISDIRSYDLYAPYKPQKEKCLTCIYSHLCDYSLAD